MGRDDRPGRCWSRLRHRRGRARARYRGRRRVGRRPPNRVVATYGAMQTSIGGRLGCIGVVVPLTAMAFATANYLGLVGLFIGFGAGVMGARRADRSD